MKYNTTVPLSAHVERLFSAGGQLLNKRKQKYTFIMFLACDDGTN